MRKIIFLSMLLPTFVFGQMGLKLKEIEKFFHAKQILKTTNKGNYIFQDISTGWNEFTSIYYNLDSLAVMVSVSRKDSFFSVAEVQDFQKNNLPKYKAAVKSVQGNTSYHYDTSNHILLLINYNNITTERKIIGFAATTDIEIIRSWLSANLYWIKE